MEEEEEEEEEGKNVPFVFATIAKAALLPSNKIKTIACNFWFH